MLPNIRLLESINDSYQYMEIDPEIIHTKAGESTSLRKRKLTGELKCCTKCDSFSDADDDVDDDDDDEDDDEDKC
jgi:hypothetical protein